MKRIITLCLVVLFVGLVPAVYLRTTRTDILRTDAATAEVVRIRNEVPYLSEYLSELENAEAILKVRFVGNREILYRSSLSEVEVLDVIKGNTALIGTHIAVYERGFFFSMNGNSVFNCASYRTPMSIETDYIIFVKKLENRRSRSMKLDEYTQDWSREYMDLPCLINDIPLNMNILIAEKPVTYADLSGYDVVLSDTGAKISVMNMETAIRQHFL